MSLWDSSKSPGAIMPAKCKCNLRSSWPACPRFCHAIASPVIANWYSFDISATNSGVMSRTLMHAGPNLRHSLVRFCPLCCWISNSANCAMATSCRADAGSAAGYASSRKYASWCFLMARQMSSGNNQFSARSAPTSAWLIESNRSSTSVKQSVSSRLACWRTERYSGNGISSTGMPQSRNSANV